MANKIGRFEILSEISRSPIGFVYKATDPDNGSTVALKTLRLDAIGEHVSEMVQRLVQESQGTGTLSSHNIAQLLGVDEIEGQFCAAIEYVQGNSVATMLARNEGFSIWDLKDIARQTAQALDHAHSRKVFHYSLEPDKIMSGWDGTIKVLGFGISAMSIPSVQLYGTIPPIMHYMSPEHWLGQPVDARANLFSLGAILYEMMTEQKAFNGADEDSLKQQILEATPAAPHEINNKISLDVSAVIMKALSKNPAERFSTGQEMVNALEGHKEATTVASAAAKKATPPAKGVNAPAKTAPEAGAKPAAPATKIPQPQTAAPKSAVAEATTKQAAAAAAGWGGTGTGSPSSDGPKTPKLDPTEEFISNCVKASIDAAAAPVMSAAPAEEPPVETTGFIVDPAMAEPKRGAAPSRSFSELNELPPLKEVYVAPPPPPAQETAPEPVAEPVQRTRTTSRTSDKPRVQPKVVAKKAVQEIKKTPPKFFGYSVAAAVVVILLIVGGIAYHIHSENAQDDGAVRQTASQNDSDQSASAANATQNAAPAPAASDTSNEPDVITIKSKPAPPKKVKAPVAVAIIPGQLNVNSAPTGAQIQIDGQSNPSWITPYDITGLAPGAHAVTVSKAGYGTENRTIEIASRSKSVMVVQLAMLAATLSVSSDPAGAKVFLDGKDMGRMTPLQISVDKPGNHTILVRKEGFLDETSTLNLQTGQAAHFTPSLRRLGATPDIKIKKFLGGGAPEGTSLVSIKTQPKNAQVAINRRVLDKPSPVEFYLNPGTYVVDITAAGYKSVQRVINVEKGSKLNIDETLARE